ncbi:MAG: zinc metalloprotease HtpX [Chloroflexi bacterium]|nr:zinc metalloprotease HtpX [Chloroflexota bacterium]
MFGSNGLKTAVLLAALTALLVFIGDLLGGRSGMVIAFGFALIMNVGSYWFSDRIALAMSGAREVSYEEAPELHDLVAELAQYARLPKPRVAIIEADAPNAFATGRDPDHAAVAVTTGIMRLLNRNELSGVLAHELGHVRNRDTLISTVAATIAGAITMLAHMAQWALFFGGFGRRDDEDGGGMANLVGGLLMIIVAPIAAALIQMAISRAREFEADATGARIQGDPEALASALEKLEYASKRIPLPVNAATSPLYIVQPLTGQALANLFSTHPPVAERVERLRRMSWGLGRRP